MTPEEYSKFIAYMLNDGDIFFALKNSRFIPGAHDKEQERAEGAHDKEQECAEGARDKEQERAEAAAQGFEYMDNMPLLYLKKIRDNLYIDGCKQVHTRLTSIGGVLNVKGKRLNTEVHEEAIVLDWNGVPTINGIRYNMSKHNRLHPKYNTFKYHPYFKRHETDD